MNYRYNRAMHEITIFSDGSSLGNPGPGGWGAIVHIHKGNLIAELGGHDPKTTNNRMEMTAAIEALMFVNSKKLEEPSITIRTDSQYLINGITKWVYGWQANGWMTKTKVPVLNKDLWQKLVDVTGGKEIEWHYVEGHAGIAGNERVDEIATSFAAGAATPLFTGVLADYPIEIKNLAPAYAGAAKQKSSSAKAYSYLSMVDGKIETHKTWAECENRVKGKKARFKKTFSKLEEENLIKEWLASSH